MSATQLSADDLDRQTTRSGQQNKSIALRSTDLGVTPHARRRGSFLRWHGEAVIISFWPPRSGFGIFKESGHFRGPQAERILAHAARAFQPVVRWGSAPAAGRTSTRSDVCLTRQLPES